MGLNLDLIHMLNVPTHVTCLKCGADVETPFDDCEVDCPGVNTAPGVWFLGACCGACGHEWELHFIVTATMVAAPH